MAISLADHFNAEMSSSDASLRVVVILITGERLSCVEFKQAFIDGLVVTNGKRTMYVPVTSILRIETEEV